MGYERLLLRKMCSMKVRFPDINEEKDKHLESIFCIRSIYRIQNTIQPIQYSFI